jgi:hypothetical protein
MDKDYLNTPEWSQDDLIIKILEFVCKNKELKAIPAPLVQRDLFPFMSENEILHLFAVIKQRDISQITIVPANHLCLKYERGLEQYIKSLDTMTKNEKLHRIVQFLTIESEKQDKKLFESDEIAKSFIPELSIYEVNRLCQRIIDENDIIDAATDQAFDRNMVSITVTPRTRSAYQSNKYLEIDEDFSSPMYPNISSKNVIVGNISGPVTQGDNSTKIINKTKGKTTLLNKVYWMIGILMGLTALITFVLKLLKII